MPGFYKSIRFSDHMVSFISFMTGSESSPLRIVMVIFRATIIEAHHYIRSNKYDAPVLKLGSTLLGKIIK